ncbi:BadF/BadG/BcrA/BcrD ATPase family protein [Arthrobacter sp. zg-Y1143]|nr:BadF/BadG/BcrA/BcrD ATPase family protein [Arthrobacter sp. zg-Y1143]
MPGFTAPTATGMRTYLGVDGGGTKTAFVLIDATGRVLAEVEQPSCYYVDEGIELVATVLRKGIEEISLQSGIAPADITQSFFGLPGYGEVSGDVAELRAMPEGILGSSRYSCDNDMICGWSGSLAAADGINVISGTGSMTYGERAGRTYRAGGWGELFGDEGSAYWIAVRGLNAFSRMSDGRKQRSELYDVMRARMNISNDLDLVGIVQNEWHGRRMAIADLSKTVVQAAELGDGLAAEIIRDACRELVQIVDVTAMNLSYCADEAVPLSYSGGMFGSAYMRNMFSDAIGFRAFRYELRTPLLGPGIGAALYAARAAGQPLSDPALENLQQLQPTT